ncbi:hypothetical protein EV175_006379, partial [Coemansia sp. RSA 1933]
YSSINYTVRTGRANDLKILRERVVRVFESAALATGCTHKIDETKACLDNWDNSVLGQLFEDMMQGEYCGGQLIGELGGSTDFGNLSQQFITLHGMYDLGTSGVPNHTAEFAEGAATEDGHVRTLFAAKTIATLAANCLTDRSFWKQVKKAHAERK